MAIARRTWTDDDGSGTTGTILNNAELQRLYDDIDAALAALSSLASLVLSGAAPGTPAAATLYKDSMVSAWARITYSAGAPSLNDDVNVASLTDAGTGIVTITFATALSGADYAVLATTYDENAIELCWAENAGTGSVQIFAKNESHAAADPDGLSVAIIGGWQ
ncbi:MAG: hypothetical protein AB7F99_17735 [Vicinamibacterales bacterium]